MPETPPSTRQQPLEDVHAFWNTEACGSHYIDGPGDTKEFFETYRQFRYSSEWHIPLLVPFCETRGRKVLEIGCGNGADGVLFALAGADYVGMDLTETAVHATRRHFKTTGLNGQFHLGNAENLPFRDDSFDLVYSYGVLHHTHNPSRALDEVHRVLRTNGRAIIMLYNKASFNYYLRIMGYMRLRLLLTIVVHTGRDRVFPVGEPSVAVAGLRGNHDKRIWALHYQAFLRQGWSYLRADSFIHHATDGPECPRAYVFTRRDVVRLFGRFRQIRQDVVHFPIRGLPMIRWIPQKVEGYLASKIGWYRMVRAVK